MKTTLPPHGPARGQAEFNYAARARAPDQRVLRRRAAHAVLEAPPAPPQTPRGLSMSVPEETEPPAAHAPPPPRRAAPRAQGPARGASPGGPVRGGPICPPPFILSGEALMPRWKRLSLVLVPPPRAARREPGLHVATWSGHLPDGQVKEPPARQVRGQNVVLGGCAGRGVEVSDV